MRVEVVQIVRNMSKGCAAPLRRAVAGQFKHAMLIKGSGCADTVLDGVLFSIRL